MTPKPRPADTSVEHMLYEAAARQFSSDYNGEKNLMISVFGLKRNKLLYCSKSFKEILGYDRDDMNNGGLTFWYEKIDPAEVGNVKATVKAFLLRSRSHKVPGTLFLSYQMQDIYGQWRLINHELSLFHFNKYIIALNFLYDITPKEEPEELSGASGTFPAEVEPSKVSISSREHEVLTLIAEGLSSKQIADVLFISNHTVITHRKNLIEKFRVKNTAQLIKEASKSIAL